MIGFIQLVKGPSLHIYQACSSDSLTCFAGKCGEIMVSVIMSIMETKNIACWFSNIVNRKLLESTC
jgi:hypothetical protein